MQRYTISGLPSYFADTYGSGSYGSSVYSCAGVTTGCPRNASSGGGLVNTGIAVGAIVGIAAVILILAIVVRAWRRPGKKTPKSDDPTKH